MRPNHTLELFVVICAWSIKIGFIMLLGVLAYGIIIRL